jgi:hypothetical protein
MDSALYHDAYMQEVRQEATGPPKIFAISTSPTSKDSNPKGPGDRNALVSIEATKKPRRPFVKPHPLKKLRDKLAGVWTRATTFTTQVILDKSISVLVWTLLGGLSVFTILMILLRFASRK